MKKLLLLLFFIAQVSVSYGQKDTTTTKTIIYDFKTKKYVKANLCPKVGEPIVLKITNINRLAYEVSIKSLDVAIADEYFKDGIESSLKSPVNENNKLETITPKVISETKVEPNALTPLTKEIEKNKHGTPNLIVNQNGPTINSNENKISQLETEKQKLIDSINTFKIKVNFFTDDIAAKTELNGKMYSITSLLNLKQFKIDSLKAVNIKLNQQIIAETNTIDAVQKTFDQLNRMYGDVISASQNLVTIEENYQNFYTLALSPLLKHEIYEDLAKDSKFILNQLTNYRSQIHDFDKSVSNFYKFYNEATNNWSIFNAIQSNNTKDNIRIKYQLYKEEVDKIKSSIDALSLTSKLRKIEAIDAILKDKSAYEMVSSPIQPLEDYVTFDVNIKHRDKNKSSEYDDNREFTYMEYTRGGVRFDFSTGVVFNFIGNHDKYELQNVSTDNGIQKKIVVTDNNQFTPTLAGMFHTSFRTCGIWAFGLTLGASINVETFELGSLFPGVSLLIGKKQKFIISAGPAFRQVEELKDNYKENGIYPSTDFNEDTQLTSKQFRLGFFCGITYNLTQKQRAKFKIGSN